MATDNEPIDWELGKAPKQSITELLHNPRGPKLELPEVTLELPALSLTPAPPVAVPEPLNINHFEAYLRNYAPLYKAYQEQKTAVVPAPRSLDTIPSHYFHSEFSLANNDDLVSLSSDESLSENPYLPQIRTQLATQKATLEHHLKRVLDEQSPALTSALQNIKDLREAILSTVAALRETRQTAEKLLPNVITPIEETQQLTHAQANLHQIKAALKSIQLITSAPSDVAILLDAGEYAAAIDTVHSAREELGHPNFARITALASVRARLAQSVESIDAALRRQFREALADSNQPLLHEVVALVSKLGRLSTLHRFFMREIKERLAESVKDVTNGSQAAKLVKASAESAVMLVEIINGDNAEEDGGTMRMRNLHEAHGDFEEMLIGVADNVLGPRTGGPQGGFIVITPAESITPETCFDEFKAALKFGEEVRVLDDLTTDLENIFCVEKRGGALRAKISERQISFVSGFHKAHSSALSEAVRADKWQEARVPEGAMRLLAAVLEIPADDKDIDAKGELESNKKTADSSGDAKGATGTFVIGSNSFKTVKSAIRYVRSMCAYTLLAENSSALSSEIARRGADYCRNFNSLVGKAILGAAALQWAGLRSITARHLSLASRTIAMAACLAEQTNNSLEKALSGPQASIVLPLLQKSEKDLRDHHGQLLAKVLAIMMDRLEAHETVLKSLPWDNHQEMQRFEIPSAYVMTLSKEATVLHRILWSILPKIEVFDIFQRVCAAYGTHLTESYSALDGGKRWIRQRVAKDVACLHERLLALDVFKENPKSFKPLSKLYNRFAKEFLEEESKNPGGRSFNRQQNKEAPKPSTPESLTQSEQNGVPAKAMKDAKIIENEKNGEHSTSASEKPHISSIHAHEPLTSHAEKSVSRTEHASTIAMETSNEKNHEKAATRGVDKENLQGVIRNESPVHAETNSFTEAAESLDNGKNSDGEPLSSEMISSQVVRVHENGQMGDRNSVTYQYSSDRENPSGKSVADTTAKEMDDMSGERLASNALDALKTGHQEQKETSVPEGDLLNLGEGS